MAASGVQETAAGRRCNIRCKGMVGLDQALSLVFCWRCCCNQAAGHPAAALLVIREGQQWKLVAHLVVQPHNVDDIDPEHPVALALRIDLHSNVGDVHTHALPEVHLEQAGWSSKSGSD